MQVFKVSLKILKHNIPSILIYIIIFLSLSLLFASGTNDQEKDFTSFEPVKNNIAVFVEEDSPLIEGFLNHLKETSNIVEVEDHKDTIADALYFRVVTYVLRVPEGFTQSFMNNGNVLLGKQTIPGSTDTIYTDLAINSFFNTAKLFLMADGSITQDNLVLKTKQVLSEKTRITIESNQNIESNTYAKFYFNFMSYSLVSIIILGTSIVMLVWKDSNIAQRTEVSPLPKRSAQFQKNLALSTFALLTWFILFFTYFLISRRSWEASLNLYLLNSLVFTFTALGLSFLIGSLLKSRTAISAVSNVLSLGPSFISGVFVPQELLGKSVLNIAKVTPTYWFVTANNMIASVSEMTLKNTSPIYFNMVIVGLFGVGFIMLSIWFDRRRKITT